MKRPGTTDVDRWYVAMTVADWAKVAEAVDWEQVPHERG